MTRKRHSFAVVAERGEEDDDVSDLGHDEERHGFAVVAWS